MLRRLAVLEAAADPVRARAGGRCERRAAGAAELALAGGTTVVPGEAPVEVRLRRFAADFSAPAIGAVQPGTA
ncbi:MAG TPA: hypothetical protein VLB47_12495 [Solirubrobacteraceae bacterium]|nr:hypothetical protein [Solirubrobacteraceae bacterium]